jgi:hypothetical protein
MKRDAYVRSSEDGLDDGLDDDETPALYEAPGDVARGTGRASRGAVNGAVRLETVSSSAEIAPDTQLDLQLNLWPDHWAWEDDNQADGEGVGPFAARKPPKRADRPRPAAIDPTDD